MRLDKSQKENLGKYLLDISKLVVGIYVFTSALSKPFLLALGCIIALLFLGAGLYYLKGE